MIALKQRQMAIIAIVTTTFLPAAASGSSLLQREGLEAAFMVGDAVAHYTQPKACGIVLDANMPDDREKYIYTVRTGLHPTVQIPHEELVYCQDREFIKKANSDD